MERAVLNDTDAEITGICFYADVTCLAHVQKVRSSIIQVRLKHQCNLAECRAL